MATKTNKYQFAKVDPLPPDLLNNILMEIAKLPGAGAAVTAALDKTIGTEVVQAQIETFLDRWLEEDTGEEPLREEDLMRKVKDLVNRSVQRNLSEVKGEDPNFLQLPPGAVFRMLQTIELELRKVITVETEHEVKRLEKELAAVRESIRS